VDGGTTLANINMDGGVGVLQRWAESHFLDFDSAPVSGLTREVPRPP